MHKFKSLITFERTRLSHGQCYSGTYRIWISMKARCYTPSHNSYPSYGGKGIEVCERWRNSFEDFIADVGERPIGYSIGRKHDLGNYEPGNAWWQSSDEQKEHKRIKAQLTIC